MKYPYFPNALFANNSIICICHWSYDYKTVLLPVIINNTEIIFQGGVNYLILYLVNNR
jgi:hypothetical protein